LTYCQYCKVKQAKEFLCIFRVFRGKTKIIKSYLRGMMTASTKDKHHARVIEIICKHGKSKEALLPCLRYFQSEFGQVTEDGIAMISKELTLSRAYILGVASFYGMLTCYQQGQYIIRVCNSLSCNMLGSEPLIDLLQTQLGISKGETTSDGRFTLEVVACLGLCDIAPAMMINEKIYGNLDAAKVQEIISVLCEAQS